MRECVREMWLMGSEGSFSRRDAEETWTLRFANSAGPGTVQRDSLHNDGEGMVL